MIPDPCKHCIFLATCPERGMVVKEAIWAWLAGLEFECANYTPENFHGLKEVYA